MRSARMYERISWRGPFSGDTWRSSEFRLTLLAAVLQFSDVLSLVVGEVSAYVICESLWSFVRSPNLVVMCWCTPTLLRVRRCAGGRACRGFWMHWL